MANTQSAKKAIRGSQRKKAHNLFWKNKIRASAKNMRELLKDGKATVSLLNEGLTSLQKTLDKASKEKVIHKNKANRIKSRYAKKVSAHEPAKTTTTKTTKTATKAKS